MGKGQIVSGGTDGQYQVKLIYAYRSRVEQKILKMQQNITSIEGQITTLDAQIAVETDIKKKESLILRRSVLNLQKTSIQKQIEYYQNNMPADPTVSAWCMDLTEDLSGNVGTAEIPGEPSLILIRPGHSGRATYSGTRDGQLMPSIAGEPNQVLFNWMLLPGWQRHKPIYRIGTIVPDSIDFDANTCSVCLDAAYSSQQSLPAIDGVGVTDCDMGDDPQSNYLTVAGEDFCSRNPGHPFCTQAEGSEINLTDAMLAQLREVNYYVNGSYGRANDKSGVAVGDHWDVMEPGGDGDCEDFALTKMQKLVDDYGWNPDNLKLVTGYAKNGEYHAMLGVRTTNRGLVVLDVNYNEVMESGRVPYRIDKIALASDIWINFSRRIDSVPIEYMLCNAQAFADGDRVIVQFTSQDWAQPKVIGFIDNPQPCRCDVWNLGNDGTGPNDFSHFFYSTDSDVWSMIGEIPGSIMGEGDGWINRFNMFATGYGNKLYIFGGWGEYGNPVVDGVSDGTYDRADKYALGAWSSIQDMPSKRCNGASAETGGKHRCISGGRVLGWYIDQWTYVTDIDPETSHYEYDDLTNAWATKIDCPLATVWMNSFVLGGLCYCFGGTTEYPYAALGQVLTPPENVYQYNHNSETWPSMQSMLRGRYAGGTGVFGENGFLFPGRVRIPASGDEPFYVVDLHGYWTKHVDKYNSTTDTWNDIGSIETPHTGVVFLATTNVASISEKGYGFLDLWAEYDFQSEIRTSKTNLGFAEGRGSAMTRHAILGA